MYKTLLASTLILALFSGCDDSISSPSTVDLPGGYAVTDSTSGDIPYPNNILFGPNSSTNNAIDNTLNIPYEDSDADAVIKRSLNTLTGFSTTAPISITIGDMDPATLAGNVHVFKVITQASPQTYMIPAVVSVERELTANLEYYATISNSKLVILPLTPLAPEASYMVVLTNGIKNAKGQALHADAATSMLMGSNPLIDAQGNPTVYLKPDAAENMAAAQIAELYRQLNQYMVGNSAAQGINPDDIVITWSFTTQAIGKVAKAFADEDLSASIVVQDTTMTSKDALMAAGYDVDDSMFGIAELYAGMLMNVPYYLSVAENNHSQAPLTNYFVPQDGTDLPELQSMQNIPLLITVPNHMEKPAAGWPVVIFQHGITKDRTMLLPVSEAFASIGYATVAIDLPLHGLTTPSPLNPTLANERTFNLDLVDNETGAPGPDGVIDASGTHYINLANPLVSRDNLRQSTSDLIALKNALATATGVDLDESKVAFVGHSLGTIASFGFLAHADLESVSLAMPGGGIAQLLNNSESFGPIIKAGLAAKGIESGTAAYESFMIAVQTLIDDGDSINYASTVKAKHPDKIYAIKVIGDAVIPNSVATAPLSGTDPLLRELDMSDINTTGTPALVALSGNTKVQYTEGDHGSILSPEASLKATVEMQTQTASFVQSLGTMIKVTYPEIIKQ
jgi:pimeloyl-ACP methyl ester carboxylesterase